MFETSVETFETYVKDPVKRQSGIRIYSKQANTFAITTGASIIFILFINLFLTPSTKSNSFLIIAPLMMFIVTIKYQFETNMLLILDQLEKNGSKAAQPTDSPEVSQQ